MIRQEIVQDISRFCGMAVQTSTMVLPVPVLQLSPDFKFCSEKFRQEMDAYLLDLFGTKDVFYVIGNDTLVLNPAMLDRIKQQIIS